ncbi:hypothetical protein BIW11_04093 [Tropilaelaps mercedesae]|uniref:SNRNP25 ubiquitin-like domain-containing protein n=1 Tax=Tropilaelaps mercedesae TaxID=418985 RepID=A0A1V9XB68_9ACAR|nr:hypothetical protein BIW11_04093 [Tropilaelaps mercedesae]
MGPDGAEQQLREIDADIENLFRPENVFSGMERFLYVIVPPGANVHELRKAVQLATIDHLIRSGRTESVLSISWKRFWRRHTLTVHGVRMDEVDASIREYNVALGDVLRFAKKYRLSRASRKRPF